MKDIKHLDFAKAMSRIGYEVLYVGFGVEVQCLSTMVIERWFPEHGMCAKLKFDGEEAGGSVVLTTDKVVLEAIWSETMGEDTLLAEDEAFDLLGELGNQLLGGFKTYLTDMKPDLRTVISTPEWLTDGRHGVFSRSVSPIPVIVTRLRHPKGDIHVGVCFDVLGKVFREGPLAWCFPKIKKKAIIAA